MNTVIAERIFQRLRHMEELSHLAKRYCREENFSSLKIVCREIEYCEHAINLLITAQSETESGEE